jgi:hypothetical protein
MNKTAQAIKVFNQLSKLGKFLSDGTIIQEGDVCIGYHSAFKTGDAGRAIASNQYSLYFRPNKEKPVSKPLPKATKYRMLGPKDIIRKGDQLYRQETRGWGKAVTSIGYTVKGWVKYIDSIGGSITRVRRPV